MSYSTDTGLARLLWQYQSSPRVRALVASMLSEFEDITDAIAALKTRLDIDASFGQQLDGIGEIIKAPRPSTVSVETADVFSFDGPDDGRGFSGVGQPGQGGRFTGVDGIIGGPLPDEEYRVFLRAIIFGNTGLSTIDHLTGYAQAVLNAPVTVLEGVGYVTVTVGRPVSAIEADLIRDTIPLAAGVQLRYIAYDAEPTDGPGGFDDGAFVGLI